MYNKLTKALQGKKKITLFSDIDGDEEIYHGYIVGLNDFYLCLWLVEDWFHDGFLVMPVQYVTGVKHGKYEKTYHQVLQSEGVLVNVSKPSWLQIESYYSIFQALEVNYNNVIVESRLSLIDEFVIGKIEKVTDTQVHLKGFDATAKWQDGIYQIPLNEITSVKFGDSYSSVLRKYVT